MKPPIQRGRGVVRSLMGMVFPWNGGQPVLVGFFGTTMLYIPCFSTSEKLRQFASETSVSFEKIKMIDNERDFFSSFSTQQRLGLRIIVDLMVVGPNKFRYTELQWPEFN